MTNDKIKDILDREEQMEINLAAFYETMLGYSLADFLPAEIKNRFVANIETLKVDSEWHAKALQNLINQYDGK